MILEISKEQFNLIQDEIIKLEEELSNLRYDRQDPWGCMYLENQIDYLKEVLETEEFNLVYS